MRTFHLLTGLTSLLTLSLAAPTPGDNNLATANIITTDASLELGKVKVCNGLRQKGICVTVNAHMQCVQLEAPVRFNVQSLVQSQGTICSYSQGKSCGNSAFTVDSGTSEQVADVSPKWSRVLTGVLCIPGAKAEAGADAAAAELPSLPHADVSGPTVGVRAESSTMSPAGDALLCAPDITLGPCFKVTANSQCLDIPAGVDRKVRMIYQNQGSYCEYFKTDNCMGTLGHSDSTHQTIRTSVPEQIGAQMGSAKCFPTQPHGLLTAEVDDGFAMGSFVAEAEAV